MRAVGAGRARLGELELDLTSPPVPTRLALVPAPDETDETDEQRAEAAEARDRVRFAHTGGVRRRLPMGGGLG